MYVCECVFFLVVACIEMVLTLDSSRKVQKLKKYVRVSDRRFDINILRILTSFSIVLLVLSSLPYIIFGDIAPLYINSFLVLFFWILHFSI